MNKIVEFSKDIEFNDSIGEIENIKIIDELKVLDNVIKGEFIITGNYKYGDISDEFTYNIPVSVMIDDKYDTSNINYSLDDFYYEIISDKVLHISVDLLIDNLVYKGIRDDNSVLDNNLVFNNFDTNINLDINDNNIVSDNEINDNNIVNDNNLTDNKLINDNDNVVDDFKDINDYGVYKVYRVCEGDSLDSILYKEGISKELLLEYNDLSKFYVGMKIIIPTHD